MQNGYECLTRWCAIAFAVVVLAVMTGAARPQYTGGVATADCLACHAQERTLSHPVDVVPSMHVPAHLPMPDGMVTCVTCHDPTASHDGSGRSASEVGAVFCVQCHDASRGNVPDLHALATERAHLGAGDRERRSRSSARMDLESERCLSCHDGSFASDGSVIQGRPGPFNAMRLVGGQHPIGVEQRNRGVGDHLISPQQITPVVRLFNGEVGCGSCHSPYSEETDLLVMSNDHSQLCLTCHDF